MPIFERAGQRILFVHIPRTGGTAVLIWFCDNGWQVINHAAHAGHSRDRLERRFGRVSIALEGPQPERVSPQHATRETHRHWAPVDHAFAIVREPVARLRSHVEWVHARARRLDPDLPPPARFANAYLRQALDAVARDRRAMDNHLRPQADFLDERVETLHYESDWPERLRACAGHRGAPPRENASGGSGAGSAALDPEVARRVLDYYAVDYETLGYAPPPLSALTDPRGARED